MGRVTLSNAAVITDDYFSAFLTLGRRVGIQKDESFLVNARHSRSALAIIDVAVKVFGAKVSISSMCLSFLFLVGDISLS